MLRALTRAWRVRWTAERHQDKGCVALVHLVIRLAVAQVAGAARTSLAGTATKNAIINTVTNINHKIESIRFNNILYLVTKINVNKGELLTIDHRIIILWERESDKRCPNINCKSDIEIVLQKFKCMQIICVYFKRNQLQTVSISKTLESTEHYNAQTKI